MAILLVAAAILAPLAARSEFNRDCLFGGAPYRVILDPIQTSAAPITPEFTRFVFRVLESSMNDPGPEVNPSILPTLFDCWSRRIAENPPKSPPMFGELNVPLVNDLHYDKVLVLVWGDASNPDELTMSFVVVPKHTAKTQGNVVAVVHLDSTTTNVRDRLIQGLQSTKVITVVGVLSMIDRKLTEIALPGTPLKEGSRCWVDILGTGLHWASGAIAPLQGQRTNAWIKSWVEDLKYRTVQFANTHKEPGCVLGGGAP